MSLLDYAGGSQVATGIKEGAGGVFNSISSVQNYINGVNGLTSQYVVLPPKGFKGGIAGFVFDYEGDDQIALEADITDHFAENNSAIEDHIALRPYRVTLRGFVSELVLPAKSQGIFGTLTTLQQTIGSVPAYLGKYTPQALQTLQKSASGAVATVQNYANTAAQYLNQAKNIAALFGGNSATLTKQQQAFGTLAQLRDQRQLFGVLTPWTFIDNMAIESLVFIQPKDSKSMSDIAVTMKQMRVVDLESAPTVSATHAGRAAFQAQDLTLQGSTPGTPVGGTALDNLTMLNLPAFHS